MVGMYTYRLFNPRPKMHMFHELLLSCHGLRNPCIAATWMGEDWLKRILTLTKKVHKNTAALDTALRWLAGLRATLEEGLGRRPCSIIRWHACVEFMRSTIQSFTQAFVRKRKREDR